MSRIRSPSQSEPEVGITLPIWLAAWGESQLRWVGAEAGLLTLAGTRHLGTFHTVRALWLTRDRSLLCSLGV